MPQGPYITGAVEGLVDGVVFGRLVQHVGAIPGPVYGGKGKAHLLQKVRGYNEAARLAPWLVLVDLDADASCAPPLRSQWLPEPRPLMCFRVAVRAIEAWLMADAVGMASFLGLSRQAIPSDPDVEGDPKRMLIELARRSPRRAIRDEMVPRVGSGCREGVAYASRMMQFAQNRWSIDRAVRASDSLARCARRLGELVAAARRERAP